MKTKEKVYKIILFGSPASGKSTQAEIVSQKLDIPIICTGDIFREEIKNKTEVGKKVERYLNFGTLVPDELTNNIVKNRLIQDSCQNGSILNGYPRDVYQAEFLETICQPTHALEIVITDEEAIQRISERRRCPECNIAYHLRFNKPKQRGVCDQCSGKLITRKDDKPAAVEKRLQVYHERTEPLVEYFQNKGIYFEIDGMEPIKKVTEEIFGTLGIR